jgi:hypothetical protein
VTVIPDPTVILIKVVQAPVDPGVTLSDWIRWIGVGVALAGLALATPDGIAAAWRSLGRGFGKTTTLIKRLIGRQEQPDFTGRAALKPMAFAGRGYVDTWMPWSEKARAAEKLDILHQQSEELRRRIDNLRTQIDGDISVVEQKIREAESRLAAQIRQVSSELSGERSQASHVDARGLLPVAFGVILTGLPDELAKVPALGWLVVAAAASSIAYISRGWLRDFQKALKTVGTEGAQDISTPHQSEAVSDNGGIDSSHGQAAAAGGTTRRLRLGRGS